MNKRELSLGSLVAIRLDDITYSLSAESSPWKLMYYFGDMRLYWKYDKRKCLSTFKFKPDYAQKRWTRIECAFIHSLQNIMRFLTCGELEFIYNFKKEK